jgi:hypothetical protein
VGIILVHKTKLELHNKVQLCSHSHLEKSVSFHLFKKFPLFYGSRWFMTLRSAFFWDTRITQRRVVILYWRFGTTYRSRTEGSRIPRQKFFFLTVENGTDTLSRNVGKALPLDAA